MCFKRSATPAVVQTDPAAQQRQAESQAAARANQESIDRQARRRRTALQTGNGYAGTALQSYGQQTLGNGL